MGRQLIVAITVSSDYQTGTATPASDGRTLAASPLGCPCPPGASHAAPSFGTSRRAASKTGGPTSRHALVAWSHPPPGRPTQQGTQRACCSLVAEHGRQGRLRPGSGAFTQQGHLHGRRLRAPRPDAGSASSFAAAMRHAAVSVPLTG